MKAVRKILGCFTSPRVADDQVQVVKLPNKTSGALGHPAAGMPIHAFATFAEVNILRAQHRCDRQQLQNAAAEISSLQHDLQTKHGLLQESQEQEAQASRQVAELTEQLGTATHAQQASDTAAQQAQERAAQLETALSTRDEQLQASEATAQQAQERAVWLETALTENDQLLQASTAKAEALKKQVSEMEEEKASLQEQLRAANKAQQSSEETARKEKRRADQLDAVFIAKDKNLRDSFAQIAELKKKVKAAEVAKERVKEQLTQQLKEQLDRADIAEGAAEMKIEILQKEIDDLGEKMGLMAVRMAGTHASLLNQEKKEQSAVQQCWRRKEFYKNELKIAQEQLKNAQQQGEAYKEWCDAAEEARLATEMDLRMAEHRVEELEEELEKLGEKVADLHENKRVRMARDKCQQGVIFGLQERVGRLEDELIALKGQGNNMPWLPESASIQLPDLEEGEDLGSGAYGEVHKAEICFTAAVKVPADPDSPGQVAELEHEASVLAAIPRHPRIIGCCGRARIGRLRANGLLLELADCSLKDMLTNIEAGVYDPVSDKAALTVVQDIIEGVQHVHRSGWLHRDIKPANILMKDGCALLADFGAAVPLTGTTALWKGTWPYISPSTQLGEAGGIHDDVRAICVTAHQLLTGKEAAEILTGLYLALSDEKREEVHEELAEKGFPDDPDMLLPVAEAKYIKITEVMSQYEELPQELLDMVLQGINAPRTLSLGALEAAVAAALQG